MLASALGSGTKVSYCSEKDTLDLLVSMLRNGGGEKNGGGALKAFGEKLGKLLEESGGTTVASAEVEALFSEQDEKLRDRIASVAKKAGKRLKGFHSMLPLLLRKGHEDFTWPDFEPSPQNIEALASKKVLCVGAGGLGCEILKNLALSGIKNIVVIDLDTIDLSNLNRQFLFRRKDVGKPKAQVAAEFIEKRCPGVKVEWYMKKIQEFGDSFYRQFSVVIAGLDNIKARLWLNAKLFSLIQFDEDGDPEPDTIIPLVDGGTEGFKGQARLFFYPFYSCFECSAADVQAGPKFELCTISTMPRIAEHCIAYALLVQWPNLEEFRNHKEYKLRAVKNLPKDATEEKDFVDSKAPNSVKLDKDNPEHMTWLYERAKQRAAEFKISGVTYNLTMQYVKNIIPAIASTNALISAACTNEAIKYLTHCSPIFNNYFFYSGQTGCYTRTFEYKKNPNCFTCGAQKITVEIKASSTLGELKDQIDKKYAVETTAFATQTMTTLFNKGLRITENLVKPLEDLLPKGGAKLVMSARKLGFSQASNFTLIVQMMD
eukprot:CAMPEP_0197533146 /NCGR_PEP_ID=MMETSP1318-20131121/42474_1 /TAXON_ID=552666 /ORGANISM="Partenskyella glossopodia, Strain RCC365" /LENGTH=544 /DNA_ID=CAMNT_0043089945 /DNA_START=53 /DNA_END=1687 /DNA_ORIENTATION=+